MSGKLHRYAIAALVVVLALMLGQSALAQGDDAGRIEIVGNIEAMGVNTLTVNGLTVDITTAQINTALEIDAAVQVEGVLLMDMSIRATEVNAAEMGLLPGELEFTGVVDALTADMITIAGLTFDISTAEVGIDVAPGTPVKVHASLSDTGVRVAREVFVAPPEEPADPDAPTPAPTVTAPAGAGPEFEIVGTLEQVLDGAIVIAGQTIDITGAEIHDALVSGALVKVHLYTMDGQFIAREVENARQRVQRADEHEGDNNDNANDNVNENENENDNTAVVVPQDCVPAMPAGWTTYTVRPGDTLFGLASRTGSSMSELALVNCITDSRVIVVGADLFVPRTPAPAFIGNGSSSNDSDHRNDDNSSMDDSNDNGHRDDDGRSDDSNDSNHNDSSNDDDNDDEHEDD